MHCQPCPRAEGEGSAYSPLIKNLSLAFAFRVLVDLPFGKNQMLWDSRRSCPYLFLVPPFSFSSLYIIIIQGSENIFKFKFQSVWELHSLPSPYK
jgi:hypothetical protein